MSVFEAVEKDLAALRERDASLADSALAATAKVLAQELDSARNSATSKSMCARALHDVMDRLRELTPAAKEADRVDEIAHRRARRVGGAGA